MGSTGKGYIRVYRDIRSHWIWSDAVALRAWLDLIMMANYEDTKIYIDKKLVTVPRGSFITSIRKLAKRWSWSKDRVLRFLRTLEQDGMLDRKRDSKKTLLTIVNYDFFQSQSGKSATQTGTVTRTQTGTVTRTQTRHSEYIIERNEEGIKKEIEPAALSSEGEICGTEDTPWWEVKYGQRPV